LKHFQIFVQVIFEKKEMKIQVLLNATHKHLHYLFATKL
jgi:hypothetical protein